MARVATVIDIQRAVDADALPDDERMRAFAHATFAGAGREGAVTLRVVDEQEIADLNSRYRSKDAPTNVLSFPAELPAEVGESLLGDVVICAPVVAREADEQGKSAEAHWAHMVAHGILHLLGYDHQTDSEAGRMEALEQRILADLGFPNPYSSVN